MPLKNLLLTMTALMASAAPALANLQPPQMQPLCSAFEQKSDGAWAVTRPVTSHGPTGLVSMAPGISFRPGTLFMGFVDLGALVQQLEQQCHAGEIQS